MTTPKIPFNQHKQMAKLGREVREQFECLKSEGGFGAAESLGRHEVRSRLFAYNAGLVSTFPSAEKAQALRMNGYSNTEQASFAQKLDGQHRPHALMYLLGVTESHEKQIPSAREAVFGSATLQAVAGHLEDCRAQINPICKKIDKRPALNVDDVPWSMMQ